jgi:hypothetical protein
LKKYLDRMNSNSQRIRLPDEPFDGMLHERFVRLLASKARMYLLHLQILCSALRLSKCIKHLLE